MEDLSFQKSYDRLLEIKKILQEEKITDIDYLQSLQKEAAIHYDFLMNKLTVSPSGKNGDL